jgi:hypothetical protein
MLTANKARGCYQTITTTLAALHSALRAGHPCDLIAEIPRLALLVLIPAGPIWVIGWNAHVAYREEMDVQKAHDTASKDRK